MARRKRKTTILIGYEGETEKNFVRLYLIPVLTVIGNIALNERLICGPVRRGIGALSNIKDDYDYCLLFADEDRVSSKIIANPQGRGITLILATPFCFEGNFLSTLRGYSVRDIRNSRTAKKLFEHEFGKNALAISKENFPLCIERLKKCSSLAPFWKVVSDLQKKS